MEEECIRVTSLDTRKLFDERQQKQNEQHEDGDSEPKKVNEKRSFNLHSLIHHVVVGRAEKASEFMIANGSYSACNVLRLILKY